ncbi:glycosyltransferase family 39 protein [Mycobacterium sp. SMC-4]|uniref:glycosyltransferase family 39 protein n=1 Tax=Mycobacterium sp. SMC-4 TaxID=2857059 RepID=UPI0021B18702|nr:glycosyltransferase family 39 protein [Mycobacterium sp. SMC-4]
MLAIANRSGSGGAAVLVGVFAAVISALGGGRPSLWVDEAATVSASTRSLGALWALLGNVDLVHGAYYLLMHGWLTVFPVTEFWMRLPSAVFVGLAAAGVVVLGTQLSTRSVGLAAGLVFAVLPRVTLAGIEARPYALTMVCAVWLTVVFVAAARHRRRWWWLGYGALLVVSAVVNILVPLVILAHGAMLVAGAAARRVVLTWAVTTTAAAVAVLPFATAVFAQRGQIGWVWPISTVTLGQFFGEQYFPSVYSDGLRVVGPDQQELTAEQLGVAMQGWARVAPMIIVLVGLAVVAVLRRRDVAGRVGSARVLLWGCGVWILVPTAALITYSLLVDPLYQPHYLSFTTPALALLAGLCVVVAAGTSRRIMLALLVIGVAAMPNYLAQRTAYAKFGSDYSEVAALLASRGSPGECLFVVVDSTPSAAHAVQGARLVHRDTLRDISVERSELQDDSLFSARRDVTAAATRGCAAVWAVGEAADDFPEVAGWAPVQRWLFNQSEVIRSERE